MKTIGFQHNLVPRRKTWRPLSPSVINRVALIDAHLRPEGYAVFLYSPQNVRSTDRKVAGYRYDHGFVPIDGEVPAINGNWTHHTRKLLDRGMGYSAFGQWAARQQIRSYVPHAFSELVGNKLETYKLVSGYDESLHPHCEPLLHSKEQLTAFVETSRLNFIKPTTGSKGNRILTLARDDRGLSLTRYYKGKQRRDRVASVGEAVDLIRAATRDKRKYILQQGVETLRHEDSTFDIRVTMLHDGETWQWLHEARISPAGSDVSNISQGGVIAITEDLLFEVLGAEASQHLLYELQSESFGLAAYLDRLHPGEILEVAFDFALDRDGRLRLLEINTKPGMAGIGSNVSVYDRRPEHEPLFERWVYPHTRHLARFLLSKAEAVRV